MLLAKEVVLRQGALLPLVGLLLVAAGAPASAGGSEGARALVAAAGHGDAAAVARLLGHGADANARDAAGRPALVAAASSGRAEVVKALLAAGADPDAADPGGWTALHEAAARGDERIVRSLLDAHARPDLRSRALGTPLDVAEREGRADVAALLRAAGARGSGKSIGDTVCVRPWAGYGFCAVVVAADPTRYRLRVSRLVGCRDGCRPDESCSAGRAVGGVAGLAEGDSLWVPASCLTDTGMR
jgi:hypothetical protein